MQSVVKHYKDQYPFHRTDFTTSIPCVNTGTTISCKMPIATPAPANNDTISNM